MAKIISFAKTTPALIAGRKTCTRRDWKASHAKRFKKDELVQAWDQQPRTRKGRKVADIRISVTPYWELLDLMPDSDYEAEGFAYFEENPELLLPNAAPMGASWAAFEDWSNQLGGLYVIRFQLEEVYTHGNQN